MRPGKRFVGRDASDEPRVIEAVLRVVIDTNIWISAFINPSGPPASLVEMARSGRLTLVFSDYLVDEIREVARRPRIRRRLRVDTDEIDLILEELRPDSVYVVTDGTFRLCRDADDDAILETAVRGSANYPASRDDDLKHDPGLIDQLAAHGVGIISVANLLKQLDAEPA